MIENIINSFTILSSIIFTIQTFPQLIKIYKKKDAKSISYISQLLVLLGQAGYLSFSLYYNYIEIYPFVMIQMFFQFILLSMKYYYDYKYVEIFKLYEPKYPLPRINEDEILRIEIN